MVAKPNIMRLIIEFEKEEIRELAIKKDWL